MIHEGDRRWSNIQIKYLQSWWEGKYELLDLGIFFSPFFCHNCLSFSSKSKQIVVATFFPTKTHLWGPPPQASELYGTAKPRVGWWGSHCSWGPGHSRHSIPSGKRLLLPCCKPPVRVVGWHLHHTNPPAADLPLTEANHSRFGVFSQEKRLQWLLTGLAPLSHPFALSGELWGHFCPHLCMYFCSHDQESPLTAVYFVPLLILGHLNSSCCTLSILFPTVMDGLQTETGWDAEHRYYTGGRRINDGLMKSKLTLH